MTDREILVDLLNRTFAAQYELRGLLTAKHTAEFLIANGVTVKQMQKPLTVEELLEIAHKTEECDRTVWMEDATGWADGMVFHVCSVVYDSDEEAFIHYMLGDDNSFETEPSHYGKTWRCWATKPTGEERTAAAWE